MDRKFVLELREARPSDLPELLRVERSAYPKERWASEQTLFTRLQLFPSGALAVWKGVQLIAFANGFPIEDRTTQEELDPPDWEIFDAKGSVWYLRNVAVQKEFQKKGAGKLLITRQLELARGFGAKHFRFTATENLRGYYSKLGFDVLVEAKSFHGLPQIVWNLKLQT